MEFGAREILVALGVLVILAILLDGVRRVRRARYSKLRMSRRKQPIFDDQDISEYGSELPSGGARVVAYRDEESAEALSSAIRDTVEKSHNRVTAPFREKPEQTSLELNEQVPVLMQPTESVAEKMPPQQQKSRKQPPQPAVSGEQSGSDEVIVLHVMAQKEAFFSGDSLLQSVLDNGLRYGSMKIFHRHEQADGAGPALFSMANSVNPGTFDLNAMDQFTTPGVSFFMALRELDEPLESFDLMMDTARGIARDLEGELKDENRSALTRQTIEHYRQRILDFSRRKLSGTV